MRGDTEVQKSRRAIFRFIRSQKMRAGKCFKSNQCARRRKFDILTFASRVREFAKIFAKQFSVREIIEVKFPSPGGVSIWSAAG